MSAEQGRTWARVEETHSVSITSDGESSPTSIGLLWSEHDPAAVVLALADPWAPVSNVIEWVVGRNLLVGAHLPVLVDQTVGRGDATVRYSAGETALTLRVDEQACTLLLHSEHLIAFLTRCANIVPLGPAESAIYAEQIDAELAAVLDGAA